MAASGFGHPNAAAGMPIGRRLELSWLRTRLDLARGGYPHLVIIEGEPGIGKTRLAQEALTEARAGGAAVLRGRCYEHLDLAYLPLRDSLFSAMTRALSVRPDRHSDMRLMEHVQEDSVPAGPDLPETFERSHIRQLLALTELAIEFVSTTTTVVFVDDIDWADRATTDFLRHLLFRLDDEQIPLMIMTTSRADPHVRAGDWVAKLRNEPRAAVLFLHPLNPMESAELARSLRPGTPIEKARELAVASGGNPLLIEALSRYDGGDSRLGRLSEMGRPPEHPVTDAVRSTLRSLSSDARSTISAAAVLGPDCTRALLSEVTGFERDRLARALNESTDVGVVVDDGPNVSFCHPLYSHIAYSLTLPVNRRALHAGAADALERSRIRGEPVVVRSVAHHVIAAGPGSPIVLPEGRMRQAGEEALALGAWSEAARYFESALSSQSLTVTESIEIHRLAGLSRRGNLQLPEAVGHFEAAIDMARKGADRATLVDLHIWRIRCAIGSREMLGVVSDREDLEELVDDIEEDHPQLAAEALVQLSQSFWVEWKIKRAGDAARRAMTIADRCGDHRASAGAAGALTVPMWASYDLRGSLATLQKGVMEARMAEDESALAGGALFRLPLVLVWLGRLDEAFESALECCAIAERAQYPLELGLPLAALCQIATVRGDFDQVEHYAHRALLIQRLTGYHWAAGLFLPSLASAHVARGQFDAARDDLDSWAQTADAMEAATVALLMRWVESSERGVAVQGGPLPALPTEPMVGADGWAAAAVEIARREGATDAVRQARDLLAVMDHRGGVFTSGLVTLIPRVLGVSMDMLGDEDEAVLTLRRAMAVAVSQKAESELARSQMDLALILMRRSERREAFKLLDAASSTLRRLGMTPEENRLEQLFSVPTVEARRASRVTTLEHSVVFFSDIVDSTRLTEELGSGHYRLLALQVENAVTSAIMANGGSIVSGISLGDGFIGLFTSVGQAISAARRCAVDVGPTGLHLHMGIHQGEIIVDGPRIYGAAVNLAARVCGLSGPDEVLISAPVYLASSDHVRTEFVDRGEHELKGIARPQRLYGLVNGTDLPGDTG